MSLFLLLQQQLQSHLVETILVRWRNYEVFKCESNLNSFQTRSVISRKMSDILATTMSMAELHHRSTTTTVELDSAKSSNISAVVETKTSSPT